MSVTLPRTEPGPEPGGARRLSACLLAWAALLFIPVDLGLGVVWPWLERITVLDEEIERARDQLARYQRLVTTLPVLRAELEAVNNNQDFKAFTLTLRPRPWRGRLCNKRCRIS